MKKDFEERLIKLESHRVDHSLYFFILFLFIIWRT